MILLECTKRIRGKILDVDVLLIGGKEIVINEIFLFHVVNVAHNVADKFINCP